MGPSLTPEQHKIVSEKIAERKAAVAASLGKTVEEYERDQHEAACSSAHAAPSAAEEAEDDCGVDEEAVLAYIRSRQQVVDRLRAQVRSLEAQLRHTEVQRDLAEKKCAALRDALTKMREQAGHQQA